MYKLIGYLSMNAKLFHLQKIILNNGDNYEVKRLTENLINICGQDVLIKEKTETVTINYVHSLMSGFQFRKVRKHLQYRWFNINTIDRHVINGQWKNI